MGSVPSLPTGGVGPSASPSPGASSSSLAHRLERFSYWVTCGVGSSWAFAMALTVVVVWLVSGPLFHYSDTWQLVINTATTIVTFLMVFLIQRAQNKEALVVQLKLNEIVAALEGASNRLIDVESLDEGDLLRLRERYEKLAEMAKLEHNLRRAHSVEEAGNQTGKPGNKLVNHR